MTVLRKLFFTVAVVAMLVASVEKSASADTVDLTLNLANFSGYTGPYANVNVNRTSSTQATITFTSLANGGFVYLLADGGSVAVNVNAASFTLGSITGSNSGTGYTP